jgi:hypothetical protein
MNWILPNLTAAAVRDHLARCARYADRGTVAKYIFTTEIREPSPRPMDGERLYVRQENMVIGYHVIVGSNRCHGTDLKCIGWQVLFVTDLVFLARPVAAPRTTRSKYTQPIDWSPTPSAAPRGAGVSPAMPSAVPPSPSAV